MNKKHLLLLLLSLSTSYIFPMLIIPRSYEMRKLRKNTNIFFHNILNKSFDEIKNDFDMLSPRRQHAILYCCQNLPSCKALQPIIMMAVCLPQEIRVEVAAQLLDLDQKSAQLFCSLPVKKALKHYIYAQNQVQEYNSPLPVGFHYRITDKTCALITKTLQSALNREQLNPAEMEQLHVLLQQEEWLIEALGIKSKFLYKEVSSEEKRTALLASIPQLINDPTLQGMLIGYRNLMGYFGCFPVIFSIMFPWFKIKQMIIPMVTTIAKTSSLPLLILMPYSAYQLKQIYNNEFDNLLEQKKEYI